MHGNTDTLNIEGRTWTYPPSVNASSDGLNLAGDLETNLLDKSH